MVSRLRVNFHKNNLMGLNVEDDFLNHASQFLYCSVGSFPWYIPVGANPRLLSTWKPVINRMKGRLTNWKSIYSCQLGGESLL